ncbi:MAG: hypothetical protein CMQ29_10285 [Gammaproteobacteria bacterium]|nr:hypothetical protein [Gammaproteobacteria bacterium]
MVPGEHARALSETRRAQAEALASRLGHRRLELVVLSPLSRAQQTAAPTP